MAEPSFSGVTNGRAVTIARLREVQQRLEAQGVRHAFLFGSVVLDLDPDTHIGLFAFESIRELLKTKIRRNVNVGSLRSLRPGPHDEILRELVETC